MMTITRGNSSFFGFLRHTPSYAGGIAVVVSEDEGGYSRMAHTSYLLGISIHVLMVNNQGISVSSWKEKRA